ncbi:MAG: YigZ family protein [Planctomycetota bacterium]|jgi:uncharacterized YigZ family protein|nr:hypothetical protein [Planctomycetota bacterium]MDP6369602.1 YigZ family protein [Planctomycetota bacterium]MDP6520512.1 YigZ family protein [Planctomycetota bacterium]MDP6838069.1 YigZ family protein [Planctomycetota bacterium]
MSEELTPASECRFEPPPIKGSRFIAHLAPAADEDEARSVLARLAQEFSDARHICWAMRIGNSTRPGFLERANDDGEPSGSAGRPILAQLEGHGVTDAVAAVVRYFGGVKLGVGGLMRAYGGAAGQCLDRMPTRAIVRLCRLTLNFAWDQSGVVEALLAAEHINPLSADYGEAVELVIEFPEAERQRLTGALMDCTAGRINLKATAEADS